jgi:hypothetical protein
MKRRLKNRRFSFGSELIAVTAPALVGKENQLVANWWARISGFPWE